MEQWPLGVCDSRTVTLGDMDELHYVTEAFTRRSYLAKWSDAYRFHYLSRMTPDEAVVFKIFDSAYHVPGQKHVAGSHACKSPSFPCY